MLKTWRNLKLPLQTQLFTSKNLLKITLAEQMRFMGKEERTKMAVLILMICHLRKRKWTIRLSLKNYCDSPLNPYFMGQIQVDYSLASS